MRRSALTAALLLWASAAQGQVVSHRGFAEIQGLVFPQTTVSDSAHGIGDVLVRDELFFRPADWLQLAGGVDVRASSHEQVDQRWRVDFADRGPRRPRLGVRRLNATLSAGRLAVDVGKQVIRWARTDIVNPIDRFAPRDFVNLVRSEALPVTGLRPSVTIGGGSLEGAWVWRLTPSRMPLLGQRWMVLPPELQASSVRDDGARFPRRTQWGARWTRSGGRLETGLAYFDGLHHLPHIAVEPLDTDTVSATRVFPRLRTYGADFGLPTRWVTVKAEAAYLQVPAEAGGGYLLYVIEIERQAGEWLLIGGYAGESNAAGGPLAFDPERGLAPAFLGRAALTVDPRRTVTVEAAIRRNGDGLHLKADYSRAVGPRWRLTLAAVILAGNRDDFLGQFNRNSHLLTGLRFGW